MKHILCLRATKKRIPGQEIELEYSSKSEALSEAVKYSADGVYCTYVLERTGSMIAPKDNFDNSELEAPEENLKPIRKKRGPRNKYDRT